MSKSKRQIKTKTITKIKKKTWHAIIAPSLFNKQLLGQTLVGGGNELLTKTIVANAMNLTGDMKKQHILITFKVTDVKDGQGITRVRAYEINPAYIKRLVRRNKNKLDLSFLVTTNEGVHVRVKPALLTKSRASGAVCAALRRKTQESLTKLFKTLSFEDIIRDLLLNKIQNILRNELKKIYPVKTAEIRFLTCEEEKQLPLEESIPLQETVQVAPQAKPKRKAKVIQEEIPLVQEPVVSQAVIEE